MGQLCGRNERKNNRSPDDRNGHKTNAGISRFFMTGMGSAGKSTIIRQLQLLCQQNKDYKLCNSDWSEMTLTDIDKCVWVNTIRRNVLDCFDIFAKQIQQNNMTYSDSDNTKFALRIEQLCDEENGIDDIDIDEDFQKSMIKYFEDQAVKDLLKKWNKIDLPHKKLFDGAHHFLTSDKISEVFSQNYDPTDTDKIHCRKPTMKKDKYRFILNGTKIEIDDVGGQKSELMRVSDYLHHWSFDTQENDQNFILLVVSMSDYNVPHAEYPKYTLLDESSEYMKLLLNNGIADKCGLLIFFNKKDRFKEKLADEQCRDDIHYLKDYLAREAYQDYQTSGKFNENVMNHAITAKFLDKLYSSQKVDKRNYCR
uniref:G-protein alpha subunit n=1 Tax=Panagrellus redivivus TaxID=6233 RepID=A0A7E4VYR4_PANRE